MKRRFPPWLKQRFPATAIMHQMKCLLEDLHLHTICESAGCPNMGECFSRKTATFLILGNVCTRSCTFCAVKKGIPLPVDDTEPQRLFEASQKLDLQYIVVTSVTRDDLVDGGASQFVKVVEALREQGNGIAIEVLIPDFRGSSEALRSLVKSRPQVINHNVETVPRLYPKVRPEASYRRSLELLSEIKRLDPTITTKSGLMVGLGENGDELSGVMDDLREANCDLLTIGQYLQPSPQHHPVAAFVSPEEFLSYEHRSMEMGFAGVASAPLVRSSFKAAELYAKAKR